MIDKKLYMDEIEHALKDRGVEFSKHEGCFETGLSVRGELDTWWDGSKEYKLCFCVNSNRVFSLICEKNEDVEQIVKDQENWRSRGYWTDFLEHTLSYLWEEHEPGAGGGDNIWVIRYLHHGETVDSLVQKALDNFKAIENRAKEVSVAKTKRAIARNVIVSACEEVLGQKDGFKRRDDGLYLCNLETGVLYAVVDDTVQTPGLSLKFQKTGSREYQIQLNYRFDPDFDAKLMIEDFVSMVSKKIS